MRVEPHTVDSIVHAVKRGARGMPITRDEADRERFEKLLFYANDEFRTGFWESEIAKLAPFERPKHWPERSVLVKVLGWCLMPNHFHLILKEVIEGGISKFMQQLCGSMTAHFNAKYNERGSIFQGSYHGRTADLQGDEYLRQLAVYVLVKNPFELYAGGLKNAIKNFDVAYAWARKYRYCSLSDFSIPRVSPITDLDLLGEIFDSEESFKRYARECMLNKLDRLKDFDKV